MASTSKLSGTVLWGDGVTPFDGFVEFIIQPPIANSIAWPSISSINQSTPTELPIYCVIPIKNGVFNQNAEILQNASIDPPNTRYTSYFYDTNRRLVGSVIVPFLVATNPYSPTIPTLTNPTAPTVPTNFPES